jgi:hypothetical protein
MNVFEVINYIKRSIECYKKSKTPWPEYEEGLKVRTHREMVGGNWEILGKLQFSFMVDYAGLKPDDVLLELACGSFRAGRFFISYLNPGNYLGMDKQKVLIDAGRKYEVPDELWKEKKPEVIISADFNFKKLSKRPNLVLAQSLFTHLRSRDIKKCLGKLKQIIKPNGILFASFCESDEPTFYARPSHSSRDFYYTFKEMEKMAKKSGWHCEYIGDWGHPHPHTKMLKYSI